MSNFKILLPFLFSTIISLTFSSYSSDSYAANVTDKHCLKPQSMVARESASSEKMLIIKRYRASSGDIACFGNELKLSVLSFKDQIANISVKKRGEKRKTFSMSANSTIHLQGLNIKLYSSGHSQTFTLRLSLKASPTDAFPGETNISACFLTSGPMCYLNNSNLFTSHGLCSDEVPRDTQMLYEGEC